MNKDFKNGCFSPNWIEVKEAEEVQKAERKEEERKKDLATLLAELEEIKNNFNNIEEKQWRLTNLMKFYTREFATE